MSLFGSYINGNFSWRKKHGEPANRRQLFLCVLSDQLFSFTPVNLLYILFWIPTVIWLGVCILQVASGEKLGSVLQNVQFMNEAVLGLIPCLAITGLGRVGMAQVMRSWASEDYLPAFPLFFRGIRENWKPALLFSCLTACIPAAVWYAYLTIMQAGASGLMQVLFVLACIAFFIIFLLQQILYGLLVRYELSLRGHVRNALILTLLHLPAAVLVRLGVSFFLLLYVLFCLVHTGGIYAYLIIPFLYYILLGGAVTELAFSCFTDFLCSRHMTAEQ
ncbi:MAG: hypothetical protein MJ118_00270 [Clostridia bacterium]|nr:hypothetical protein [Clostridia bacterium]